MWDASTSRPSIGPCSSSRTSSLAAGRCHPQRRPIANYRRAMSAEFDRYARDYDDLLRDPIRDRFAGRTEFYHLRKWLVIQDLFRRRSTSSRELCWLDVGCGKGELLHLGKEHFRTAMGCDP